jgi:hypothetical protein
MKLPPQKPSHPPLSTSLETLLNGPSAAAGVTPNDILLQTEGRGLYLLMILVCLPFSTPISIPGVSSFSGGIVLILALRIALGLPPKLPRWIGEKRMSAVQQRRLLGASIKVLHWMEKGIKPCAGGWLAWPVVNWINMVLLGSMGFLLALPVPLPFTNTIPAYAILLLAISLMEEDGRVVWLGYIFVLGTYLYFGLMAGTSAALIHKYFQSWFG